MSTCGYESYTILTGGLPFTFPNVPTLVVSQDLGVSGLGVLSKSTEVAKGLD